MVSEQSTSPDQQVTDRVVRSPRCSCFEVAESDLIALFRQQYGEVGHEVVEAALLFAKCTHIVNDEIRHRSCRSVRPRDHVSEGDNAQAFLLCRMILSTRHSLDSSSRPNKNPRSRFGIALICFLSSSESDSTSAAFPFPFPLDLAARALAMRARS